MPATATKVEIGFDLSAIGDPTLFTLDDPVQGELDSAFVLGGTIYQDVTSYVRSVSIRRGRSRRLDKYQTGNATVVLDNRDRRFDPAYAGSPYAGQVKPRRPIRIMNGGVPLFTGLVEDWNLDYSLNRDSVATAACVDGFVLLAGAELDAYTNISEFPGARVTAVLDRPEVAWPAGLRDIAAGGSLLQADAVTEGTNVLSYLQLVEETENGALYVGADGVLIFKAANTPPSDITDLIFSNVAPVDPGIYLEYSGLGIEYGTETLYNRVVVTRVNSTATASADDLPSQAEYGISSLDKEGLLFANDSQLSPVAEYLVTRYGNPEVRIRNVTVSAHALENATRSRLFGLDFGDVIRVLFRPNGIGYPIDQLLSVEGVSHSVGISTHEVTLDLELITYLPFVLDSGDYGILDANRLGV